MPGDIIRIGRQCLIFLLPNMPVQRAPTDAAGWLHGLAPSGLPLRLPVTRVPILIGAAALADIPLRTPGAPHLAAHIYAAPKGPVLTDLTGDLPRMHTLTDGQHLDRQELDLQFSTRNPDAAPDHDALLDDPELATWNAELATLNLDSVLAAEVERVHGTPDQLPRRANFAPQASANTCITARSGPAVGATFRVGTGKTVIGRARDAGIYLADSLVSRSHAQIIRRHGALVVEDLNSENGTLVNGEPIVQYALQPGDIIRVGLSEFLVHL